MFPMDYEEFRWALGDSATIPLMKECFENMHGVTDAVCRKLLRDFRLYMDELKKEFWSNVYVPGEANDLNVELEKALRLADFIEIGTLMAHDAMDREESCGGHFRIEHQTEEGEAKRDDENFAYVSCWEYQGEDKDPVMYKEELVYEETVRAQRNYKS